MQAEVPADKTASGIPCSRPRDVGKSLENAGFARPARDIVFQEDAEFRGFLRRADAAVTDLVKLLRHNRLDEFAHGYVAAAASSQTEGGNDGNARQLCVDKLVQEARRRKIIYLGATRGCAKTLVFGTQPACQKMAWHRSAFCIVEG